MLAVFFSLLCQKVIPPKCFPLRFSLFAPFSFLLKFFFPIFSPQLQFWSHKARHSCCSKGLLDALFFLQCPGGMKGILKSRSFYRQSVMNLRLMKRCSEGRPCEGQPTGSPKLYQSVCRVLVFKNPTLPYPFPPQLAQFGHF